MKDLLALVCLVLIGYVVYQLWPELAAIGHSGMGAVHSVLGKLSSVLEQLKHG